MVIRTAVTATTAAIITVMLAACGGSGGPAGSAAPAAAPAAPLAAAPVLAAAAVTGAPDIEIDNYTLVSSTRISRTVYEYTYTADVSNWGTADTTISATLASTVASTTVMEGAVSFGDVLEGATEVSTDTFTIRQDRGQPFNDDALTWTVQAVPLAPTTFELIDQALADGVINAETALVYKVFYEFHDDRLPTEYRGRADGFPEATAFQEAVDNFESLSQATRDTLRPFLLPPNDPESWYQLSLGQPQAQARALARVASPEATGNTVAASVGPIEDLPGGIKRVLVAGKVYVYWNDQRYPQDAAVAFRVSDAIDQTIWPKLTALLGEPPFDASGILDVRIVNTASMAIVYQRVTGGTLPPNTLGLAGPACYPNIPVVYLNRDDTQDIVQTAAHEITHAILARFPLSHGCNDRYWLGEATATWAEHYVYRDENTEHKEAPAFLNEPALSLETTGDHHEYGAYLWFLYLTQGDTSGATAGGVPATWAALAAHDSLGAVNAAAGTGGLEKQWPEFALYNWNRISNNAQKPYRYYNQWDKLTHKARESTTAAPANATQPPKKVTLDGTIYRGYPLFHTINHLGAKYWHFDFTDDENIRRVRVIHPYSDGSQPTAKVQVIAKMRTKEWMPAEDWTGYARKTLCRDRLNPNEDFEELIVVISDSEYTDRSHVLDDSGTTGPVRTFVEVSALGCSNWKGSVDFSVSGSTSDGSRSESLHETGKATDVTLEIDHDRFSYQDFKLTGGVVNWTHSGNYTTDGRTCSGESGGSYGLANPTPFLEWIGAFEGNPLGTPPTAAAYSMYGRRFSVTGPAAYICTSINGTSSGSPINGYHNYWLDMGFIFPSASMPALYDSDPTGNVLQGSSLIKGIVNMPGDPNFWKWRTYTWTFQKNGTYAGEPEL